MLILNEVRRTIRRYKLWRRERDLKRLEKLSDPGGRSADAAHLDGDAFAGGNVPGPNYVKDYDEGRPHH